MKLSEKQALILLDVARQAVREKAPDSASEATLYGYDRKGLIELIAAVIEQQDDKPQSFSREK